MVSIVINNDSKEPARAGFTLPEKIMSHFGNPLTPNFGLNCHDQDIKPLLALKHNNYA